MLELANFQLKHYLSRDCSNGWHLDEHVFPSHSLSLLLRGSIEYKINHQSYHVERGDLVYSAAGSTREATPSSDCIFIAIDFESKEGLSNVSPVTKVSLSNRVIELLDNLEFHWLQYSEKDTVKAHLVFLELLYELLYHKTNTTTNRHVQDIKRYISQNYFDSLTVEKIAAEVQLNPVYCGALFKQEEGKTILEYLNHIRINRASNLLEEGHYNITQISELCGYKDVYYFSKTFKKIKGFSPKKYWAKNQYISN